MNRHTPQHNIPHVRHTQRSKRFSLDIHRHNPPCHMRRILHVQDQGCPVPFAKRDMETAQRKVLCRQQSHREQEKEEKRKLIPGFCHIAVKSCRHGQPCRSGIRYIRGRSRRRVLDVGNGIVGSSNGIC